MEVETAEISASYFDCISDIIFRYHFPFCNVLFTNIVSSVKGFFERKIER